MYDNILDFIINIYSAGVLFLSASYIYFKTTVIPVNGVYRKPFALVTGGAIISVLYAVIYMNNSSVAQLVSYLYPALFYIVFERKQILLKCLVCFFASCFARILLQILFVPFSILFAALNIDKVQYFYFLIYALLFLLVVLIFRTKRFRKGFQFFQNEKNTGLGLVLAGILFFLQGYIYTYELYQLESTVVIVLLLSVFIISVGLYFWIRRGITAHYREKMKQRSENYNRQTLAGYEQKLDELRKSNEMLAKALHRDNHLISALSASIDEYFNSGDREFNENLLCEIQTLAKERADLIDKEQRESKILPSTGSILIDGAVNDLYIKAAAHGIDFNLDVAAPVDEITGKYLSQTELQTLLCDHIKDAVTAVDAGGKGRGKILVSFSVKDNNYDITIFDSGVDFETETLSRLGKERVTTHAENGGSGIGFMTTFETLKKAYASLIITEFENKIPFSKSVSFRFDGLAAFVIQSYRAEELKSALNRDDVIIM